MTVEKLCLKADVQLALKQRAENICQEIETREQIVKAFVSTIGLRERLDAQLEMLEQKYGSGAELPSLWGTTIGVKDVFFTDTLATRAGYWLPTDAIKGERSIVVSQLLNAGAILLGKTACSEFGYQKAANTCNPLYPHYSPGGSSSGSAAAVAAGFCDLGVGSQSRAGVTLPSAFCGVNGFTASAGRISKQGMFHLSQSLEQIGLFAKDMKVIKHAAKVLLLKGATTPEAALDMRFGIPSRSFLALAEPQIIAQF
ncbi:MAG: amidase family protein, partial [Candidatus Cloacimonetes bacterium]|nr:amidase family protein [Candidatus Cloacimonadota bacterium]